MTQWPASPRRPQQQASKTHSGPRPTSCVQASGTPDAERLKGDAAFFEAVRAQLSKAEGSDEQSGSAAEVDTAIRQLVSDTMVGVGVIDVYELAGIPKPDLSMIDDDFIARFTQSDRKNLQLEMLRRLLSTEIASIGKRNIVASKQFSEMLSDSLLPYQNRTLDSAQVIAALADLARRMTAETNRAEQLGLTSDELAFYDAIRTNESAASRSPMTRSRRSLTSSSRSCAATPRPTGR